MSVLPHVSQQPADLDCCVVSALDSRWMPRVLGKDTAWYSRSCKLPSGYALVVPQPHQMSDSLLYRRSTTSGAMYERLPVVSV